MFVKSAQPTVLGTALSNAGIRKGMRGAQFLLEWAIAAADGVEFDGSVTEQLRAYIDWWDDQVNERTAWRRLADFRESFPDEDTPARLAVQLAPRFVAPLEQLRELGDSKKGQRKAVGSFLAGGLETPLPV